MLKHLRNKLFKKLFGEPIEPLKPKTPNPNPNYRPPCCGSNIPEQPNVPPMPKAIIQRVGFSDLVIDDSIIMLPKGMSIHRSSDGWEIKFRKEELTILLSDIK